MSFYFIIDKRERPGSKRQTSLLSYYGENIVDEEYQENIWTVKAEFSERVKFENLECGDICFYMDDKPILLIERKDVKDLAGCINTKSYKEQKIRMKKFQSENPQLKLVYLIEDFHILSMNDLNTIVNPMAPKSQHVNKQTILSAIVSTMFRDGFFAHITESLEGTIAFIERLYAKLPTYPKKGLSEMTSEEGKHEYLKQVSVTKSKNVDNDAWFLFALSQIPGVSLDKGKGIQEQYKNMPNLISEFGKCSNEKTKENMLTCVPKIGKILSKRIYEYICGVNLETKII
jgi:ERCC4-type nuclease